jgi:hypothetical protein
MQASDEGSAQDAGSSSFGGWANYFSAWLPVTPPPPLLLNLTGNGCLQALVYGKISLLKDMNFYFPTQTPSSHLILF